MHWPDIQDLPKTLGYPKAYDTVWGWVLTLSRETIAFFFLGIAVLWILWMDVRPSVRRWWRGRMAKSLVAEDFVYAESFAIKVGAEHTSSPYYLTRYYLNIGNGLDTGKSLKRVQARIFHCGPPTLCRVKDRETDEIDIRHGESAHFEIGQYVFSRPIGLMMGIEEMPQDKMKYYSHNIPIGHYAFEVTPFIEKQRYSLGTSDERPAVWKLLIIVSADEQKSLQVEVNIDMAKQSNHLTATTLSSP